MIISQMISAFITQFLIFKSETKEFRYMRTGLVIQCINNYQELH